MGRQGLMNGLRTVLFKSEFSQNNVFKQYFISSFTIDSDCKHRVSKIILEAYPILATLCDVIDLTNQSFAEKIRVAGCRPSVPVG